MRISSFLVDGRESYGLVVGDDGLIDLGTRLGSKYRSLRDLIASGELYAVADEYGHEDPDHRLGEIRFLPPIPHPYTIMSSGGLFPGHIKEMIEGGIIRQATKYPGFHIKSPSSIVGHLEPLVRPKSSKEYDYENELAIVIGKRTRNVRPEEALDHVLGYACFNDGSVRDFQRDHSVGAGKNAPRSSSFGPWIVTRDEVGDIDDSYLTTRLNGEVVQHERVGDCIMSIGELVSYFSSVVDLQPGDVVTTGTCAGVGAFHEPPLFMKAGDTLEIEVDRVGSLKHQVIDEA